MGEVLLGQSDNLGIRGFATPDRLLQRGKVARVRRVGLEAGKEGLHGHGAELRAGAGVKLADSVVEGQGGTVSPVGRHRIEGIGDGENP